MKNRGIFILALQISWFALVTAIGCKNNAFDVATAQATDFRTTFFEKARPAQDKTEWVAKWKKEVYTDSLGWMQVPSQGLTFSADNLDEFLSEHFDKNFDPEFAVKSDAEGKYLIARNGNRTKSFFEISFSHVGEGFGMAFVHFDSCDLSVQTAANTTGTWLIFDQAFTQVDTLDWAQSSGRYAIAKNGVWDSPTGKGLRFRSFKFLYGDKKVPETYQMTIEKTGGRYYLTNEFEPKTHKVILD